MVRFSKPECMEILSTFKRVLQFIGTIVNSKMYLVIK